MKCANCRCEIGNQSACPYCGRTVIKQIQRPPTKSEDSSGSTQSTGITRVLHRVIGIMNNVDLRVKLCITLLTGVFLLQLLTLLVLIIK